VSYPGNFLRGFSDKGLLTPDGVGVSAAVFFFDVSKVNNGWLEQSVCWEDDGSVVDLMLRQKNKDGAIQFKAAIARVPRSCLHYINRLPQTKELLSYERKELEENPYHGNLLLKKDTHKITMTKVAAMIAGHVLDVINQE
jgi:hypothetical protein